VCALRRGGLLVCAAPAISRIIKDTDGDAPSDVKEIFLFTGFFNKE